MNMMDKFNCDIMNVNDMHEKQNDNFDTFEKEEMHLNMSSRTYRVILGLVAIVLVIIILALVFWIILNSNESNIFYSVSNRNYRGNRGNMGSCDILLTRIFVNKIIIKSARETFMKKILLSFGCCLILAAVLVIAKISVTYYFTQLKNSDTLSYVLYFIFAVGSILIIRHIIKN